MMMEEAPSKTPSSYSTVGAVARKSQPAFNPSALGGYSVVPRRGIASPGAIATKEGLQGLACGNPLRLLSYLADLDPNVGLATWNALRLTTAPGAVKIVAMKESKPGAGDASIDDAGTAELDARWEKLPEEIGGLQGLLRTLIFTLLFSGLICIEAVPGPALTGLDEVWPVDSLTVAFRRITNPAGKKVLQPHQWQIMPQEKAFQGQYVPLDMNTFFWRALDNGVDDAYGRAPYAPALMCCLRDVAMINDLHDAIHNSGFSRYAIGFNWKAMAQIATDVYKITDPVKVNEWVLEQFEEAKAAVASAKPDDNFVFDSDGGVETIEGAQGLSELNAILSFLRTRIVQSLKSLPTLMGINDGSTQTYTTVEWQIYAAGLESLRDLAVALLVRVANLHLQLLGLPLKAAAQVEKIRTNDRLVDAQAEAIQIKNAKEKIRMGMASIEQMSIEITGSGPVADPMPGAFDPTAGSSAGDGTQDPNAVPAKAA